LPPSPPVRIWIPSIGVTSGLVRLGLEPDGTLQVPSEFGVAGWWAGGPSPGEKGAAVIVGHVDSTAGPGVFFRLPHLRPGAVVWVSREDQAAVEFVVQRIEQVPKTRFPTKEVYGPQPNATLRLVTCGGAFDHSTGHYVDNVIVFASAAH
jgi:sortase (surface protein transpeptidase)